MSVTRIPDEGTSLTFDRCVDNAGIVLQELTKSADKPYAGILVQAAHSWMLLGHLVKTGELPANVPYPTSNSTTVIGSGTPRKEDDDKEERRWPGR